MARTRRARARRDDETTHAPCSGGIIERRGEWPVDMPSKSTVSTASGQPLRAAQRAEFGAGGDSVSSGTKREPGAGDQGDYRVGVVPSEPGRYGNADDVGGARPQHNRGNSLGAASRVAEVAADGAAAA
ncbi:hypothetical protein [Nocardia arizonensis]|uniref:hypothetical protein n=1 Tax=Nocardia arizonensis TaxID=1141647 RepID=UPI0006CF4992